MHPLSVSVPPSLSRPAARRAPARRASLGPPRTCAPVGSPFLRAPERTPDGKSAAGATILWAGLLAASVALAGCGGTESSGSSSTGPTGPTVASVALSSPIEGVMAVDRTVQLDAVARDASGGTVSGAAFTWESSDPSVASVDGDGVVAGLTEGSAEISASADGVSGSLEMRVVSADLSAVATILGDAFTDALATGLGDAQESRVQSDLDECSAAVDAGHVLNLSDCLGGLPDDAATEPTNRALLSVLSVIALRAELLLNL